MHTPNIYVDTVYRFMRKYLNSDILKFDINFNVVDETGDMPQRLCTAADLRFYFTNFIASANSPTTFLRPNRNCNVSSWVSGCEPGWACSADLNEPLDYKESREIPARTSDCQPCCEGFFCPQGLTCMIRKSLSFCLLSSSMMLNLIL